MRPYLIEGKKYIECLMSETTGPMVCDLENAFDEVKVLSSGSSSSTNQFIVTDSRGKNAFLKYYLEKRKDEKKSPQVFIKFMPVLDESEDNRMNVELAIYKYLYIHLIGPKVTPHIMKFVASAQCTNLNQVLDIIADKRAYQGPKWVAESRATEKSRASEIWGDKVGMSKDDVYNAIKDDKAKAIMMFLELGTGMTLWNLCQQKLFDPSQDLKPLLFQVGYTLKQMHTVGVRHNDLHGNNVWIDILPSEELFQYDLGNGQYAQIKTRYIPKIYDFDLSTFTSTTHLDKLPDGMGNQVLDTVMCANYGMCSVPDPLYDWLSFCHTVNNAVKTLALREKLIANKILKGLKMDVGFLKDDGSKNTFPGRYCNLDDGNYCDPIATVPENMIVSFDQLVEDGFFPFVHSGKVPKAINGITLHRTYTSLA